MGYLEQFSDILDNFDFVPVSFQLYSAESHKEFFKNIDFSQYDIILIAFSLMTIQIPLFDQFISKSYIFFNNFHDHIYYIVGGAHATANPKYFASKGIHFIIQGEGEFALKSLLLQLIDYRPDDINITSLYGVSRGFPYFESGKPSKLIEIGKFPPFSEKYHLFGPIELSRGCPFQCKFCQTGNFSQKMRHAPVEQVLSWIKKVSEIKYDKVWFLTPNAFGYGSKNGVNPNLSILHQLLSGIHEIAPKIKKVFFGTFPSEVRPESVTDEVIRTIKPFISNKKFIIGAQTASNRLLKEIKRGHTFEDVLSSIEILKQHNFDVDLDFIFGLPGENENDIEHNLQFFTDVLNNKYPNVRIHTHTFIPLPGTPFEFERLGMPDPRIVNIIGKLAQRGKAYGTYQVQAHQITNKFQIN